MFQHLPQIFKVIIYKICNDQQIMVSTGKNVSAQVNNKEVSIIDVSETQKFVLAPLIVVESQF